MNDEGTVIVHLDKINSHCAYLYSTEIDKRA